MARADEVLLKSLLDNSRRVHNFEKQWLKRNHPEVFEQLKAASEKNDEAYLKKQVDDFGDKLSNRFGL